MKGIKIVWFDLDDTVWDFRSNSRLSQNELYSRFGLDRFCISADLWIDTYERHNSALWKRYNVGEITRQFLMEQRFVLPLLEIGMPMDEAMEVHSAMSDAYLDLLGKQTALIPGAREAVHMAKERGYKVGIISNGFREVQYKKLASGGLSGMFDVVVLSDEIGVNKPDIRLFRYAEEKAGVCPGESMIIGDNPAADIAGAVNAGWQAVFFNRDSVPAELPAGVPEITDLGDLRSFI